MTEQEKIDRGQQAAALLAHPLLKEALDAIADQCLRDFAAARPEDTAFMTQARMMLETAHRFRKFFDNAVSEGRNAATKAEHVPQEIE